MLKFTNIKDFMKNQAEYFWPQTREMKKLIIIYNIIIIYIMIKLIIIYNIIIKYIMKKLTIFLSIFGVKSRNRIHKYKHT